MSASSGFEGLGLPVASRGLGVTTLSFSAVAGVVVVTLGASREWGGAQRAFARRVEERAYSEIVLPDTEYALTQALAGLHSARAYLNARREDGRGYALFSVSLADMSISLVPPLRHREGVYLRSWVSELLSIENDTSLLGVVAGAPAPDADGSYNVRYAVGRVDTTSGEIDVLAELATPFA